MEMHERIRARREECDLKVDDVARKLGVSRATIYRYESAEIKNMGVDKVAPLAAVLNTTPEYLMGWVDDPTNYEDGDLIADNAGAVLDHFNGDVAKANAARKARDNDAMNEPLPPLTKKDEAQIAKDLEAMLNSLDAENGMAAYNDPEDQEDRQMLRASLEYSMKLAKQMAKKKFTPHIHRKE